jgi:hypothetical protein
MKKNIFRHPYYCRIDCVMVGDIWSISDVSDLHEYCQVHKNLAKLFILVIICKGYRKLCMQVMNVMDILNYTSHKINACT